MRGRSVASRASMGRMTAPARVLASCDRYLLCETKPICSDVARSSGATWLTACAPSPTSSPPKRATSAARVTVIGWIRFRLPDLLAVQGLHHPVGDVVFGVDVNRLLDDDVEFLGARDVLNRLARALLDMSQFLVAAQVEVLAELASLALQIAIEVAQIPLLRLSLAVRHGHAVLVELRLEVARLLGELLQRLFAGGELAFQLLLRGHRQRRLAQQALGVDEADLGVGQGGRGGERRRQNQGDCKLLDFHHEYSGNGLIQKT